LIYLYIHTMQFSTVFVVALICVGAFGISGKVTWYAATGEGTCSFIKDTSSPLMITAYPGSNWNHAANCGRCVNVTYKSKSIVVKIIDQCPGCSSNQLDLARDAFAKLEDLSQGVLKVDYNFVACPTKGNILYRVKSDSSQWWQSIVVNNHRVGLKSFQIKGKNNRDWITLQRKDYNEFESPYAIEFPVSFRVTSIEGKVITDTNIIKGPNWGGQYRSSGQF